MYNEFLQTLFKRIVWPAVKGFYVTTTCKRLPYMLETKIHSFSFLFLQYIPNNRINP